MDPDGRCIPYRKNRGFSSDRHVIVYRRETSTTFIFRIFFFLNGTLLDKKGPKNFWISSWWFEPIWKILVKLDHFPK